MDTQTTQPIVLDSKTLEQLKEEIQQELRDIVKNSNISNVLKKYGIGEDNVLQIQCKIDLSKIQLIDIDAVGEKQAMGLLSGMTASNTRYHLTGCCIDQYGDCVPCK